MQSADSQFWWIFFFSTIGLLAFTVATAVALLSAQRRKLALERRQFEEIARREEKYRSLVANSIAGLMRLSLADGSITEANDAALSMFSVSSLAELNASLPVGLGEGFRTILATLRGGSTLEQVEYEYRINRQHSGWFLFSGHVNASENTGELVVVNISQEKKLYDELLRTQRLESIGTLSSGVAHDLNNILTPILLSSEVIERSSKDDMVQQATHSIQRNLGRATSLIRQLLTFARGSQFQRIPLEPSDLLQELRQLLEETFPKHIAIDVNPSPSTWAILGDRHQLMQVLANLCINARDAMPNGGALFVSMRNAAAGNPSIPTTLAGNGFSYIVIEVRDTGSGISPDHLNRVFDPFFTTKEAGKGTGLGLSISHGIIKSHGGIITVESTLGVGSTFRVWLPASNSTVEMQQNELVEEFVDGSGTLVLVIDDEAQVLDSTQHALEAHGFEVLTAMDGEEGLQTYLEHRPHVQVVLTDIMMPELAGVQTIRALHGIDPQLPIVAMSGVGLPDELLAEPTLLVKAFLQKPFSGKELVHAVQSSLHQRVSTQPSDKSNEHDRT